MEDCEEVALDRSVLGGSDSAVVAVDAGMENCFREFVASQRSLGQG